VRLQHTARCRNDQATVQRSGLNEPSSKRARRDFHLLFISVAPGQSMKSTMNVAVAVLTIKLHPRLGFTPGAELRSATRHGDSGWVMASDHLPVSERQFCVLAACRSEVASYFVCLG